MPGTRSMPGAQAPDAATRPLRIGVIGVGRIGRMHAELLARQVPGAAVTWIHDEFEASARTVAESLGAVVASDLDELLNAPDVDAVVWVSVQAALLRSAESGHWEDVVSLRED